MLMIPRLCVLNLLFMGVLWVLPIGQATCGQLICVYVSHGPMGTQLKIKFLTLKA